MRKSEAINILNDTGTNGATEIMRRALKKEWWNRQMLVLGRFEAMGPANDDDTGWIPMIISRDEASLVPIVGDIFGRLCSQGGARVISGSQAGDGGYAFQSRDGIWCWGMD